MKEHPDYKYRPRRKPKTLVKSPTPNNNNNNAQNQSSVKESPPHSQTKYTYPNFDTNLPRLAQLPPAFPLAPYAYDFTFADLQARIHAMYCQSYLNRNPFHQFTPPEITPTTPSPPSVSTTYGCAKPKSPPIVMTTTPMHQASPNGANVI